MENTENLWPGWETVRVIGKGGFGTVYEIQREVFGKIEKSALKVITIPENLEEIDELYSDGYDVESITIHYKSCLEDIVREYSYMLDMKGNTNIVYCDDLRYIQHDNGIGWDIYIKMELLTPLTKVLSREYNEYQTIKLGIDICNALILCKKASIVHRDIKPQNIFVSNNGDYKLGDFGIAKVSDKTTYGTQIGTFEYMAPEIYHGEAYGVGTDIYSLGMVLYWMMNDKRTPFLPLPPEIPTASMKENARFKRFKGEELPEPAHGSSELKRIVIKACAYNAKDRYLSAIDMMKDLKTLVLDMSSIGNDFEVINIECDSKEDKTVCLWNESKQGKIQEDKTERLITEDVIEHLCQEDKTERLITEDVTEHLCQEDKTERLITEDVTEHLCQEDKTEHLLQGIDKTEYLLYEDKMEHFAKEDKNKICYINVLKSITTLSLKKKLLYLGSIAAFIYLIFISIILWGDFTRRKDNMPQDVQVKTKQSLAEVNDEDLTVTEVNDEELTVTDFASGYDSVVYLMSDGTLKIEKLNELNFDFHIYGWKNIKCISANGFDILALKEDGTVIHNIYWMSGMNKERWEVGSWKDIIDISLGAQHSVGLKDDGTVVAVGDNSSGQCDVSEWKDIIAVCAGWYHTVGLKEDGTVVATGTDDEGECDVSEWKNIIDICADCGITVGLKEDGTVLTTNSGLNDITNSTKWTDIVDISAGGGGYNRIGYGVVVGLKKDGTVVSIGAVNSGEDNISEWTDIVKIRAGGTYTIGQKRDGTFIMAKHNILR